MPVPCHDILTRPGAKQNINIHGAILFRKYVFLCLIRSLYRLRFRLFLTWNSSDQLWVHTVYPKKYAHGFCFAVFCCGYTLTDFPISIRLTSLALWQSNDCPSASKTTLMNMDKYFMWIHYERLHNHNKAKHNKTVCIFLGIYCTCVCVCVTLRTLCRGMGRPLWVCVIRAKTKLCIVSIIQISQQNLFDRW